jgi:hypothetical protein
LHDFLIFSSFLIIFDQKSQKSSGKLKASKGRHVQETPRAGQEGSRPSKIAPRGSKRHRGCLTSKRGTWSNSKDALLRCPATEWQAGMPKDGGRAAVSPQRGRQSAARPVGVEQGVLD